MREAPSAIRARARSIVAIEKVRAGYQDHAWTNRNEAEGPAELETGGDGADGPGKQRCAKRLNEQIAADSRQPAAEPGAGASTDCDQQQAGRVRRAEITPSAAAPADARSAKRFIETAEIARLSQVPTRAAAASERPSQTSSITPIVAATLRNIHAGRSRGENLITASRCHR